MVRAFVMLLVCLPRGCSTLSTYHSVMYHRDFITNQRSFFIFGRPQRLLAVLQALMLCLGMLLTPSGRVSTPQGLALIFIPAGGGGLDPLPPSPGPPPPLPPQLKRT